MKTNSPYINLSDEASDNLACFDVMRLATMRAAELAAFESHINDLTARAVSALQRMPVRLRRRAASHRVNRLPYRLHRHYNLSQQKSESVKQVKKTVHKLKSRRFRRRKLRLIAKHARLASSQTNVSQDRKPYWLPTHIWHAKRFHMTTEWGWRLPVSPTNKVFKACHKASHRGCIVFDLSYFTCFQLSGLEQIVGSCINECFLPDAQIHTFLPQKTKLNTPQWSCEQTGILFADFLPVAHDKQIARSILGPARILWGSTNLSPECVRHVWIWIHPSISKLVWDLFQMYIHKTNTNEVQHQLSLKDMTGKFCRLRTLGSQSHGLLSDIFTSDQSSQKDLTKDWKVWNQISKLINQAVCTPPGLIITLSNCAKFLANRPRLKIRNRDWSLLHISDENSQEKVCGESNNENLITSQIICGKQLFWSDIQNHLPDILTMSPEKLLSTNTNELEDSLSVVLIQNGTPSVFRHSPESVGWDVVFKRSSTTSDEESVLKGSLAARDFLIASVYRGAEVGGIHELRYWGGLGTLGSAVSESFPYSLWPDTAVGKEISSKYTADKIARFNRLPQQIRPDYNYFGTTNPFSYPWNELISSYSQVVSDSHIDWFVLRDPALLRLVVHRMVAGDSRACFSIEQLNKYNPLLSRALILVRLTVKGRGIPQPHAIIYLANGNYFKRFERSLDYQGKMSKHIVLGYVQEGGYSMTVGHGVALGFISLAALSYGLTNNASSNHSQMKSVYLFKNSTSHVLKSTSLSVVI